MKSKSFHGNSKGRKGKTRRSGGGEAPLFPLDPRALRFMTFSTCRSLDERHERKVAERLNAAVLKTVDVVRRPGVQIPPLPPKLFPYFSK